MTRNIHLGDLDRLLAEADPAPLDRLATSARDALDRLGTELMDDCASSGTSPRRHRPMPTRWRRAALLAGAAAAATAALMIVDIARPDRTDHTAWAAPLVAMAQRSPLLLVDDPAWKLSYADESKGFGELDYVPTVEATPTSAPVGAAVLALTWSPAAQVPADRSSRSIGQHPVPGGRATLFDAGSETFVAQWNDIAHAIQLRLDHGTLEQFTSALDHVRLVDVETWLRAMPASTTQTDGQPGVIRDMLTGVPLPAAFDPTVIATSDIADRYQLGVRVTGAVVCAWVDQWFTARAAGDAAAQQRATQAMATARNWPILREMAPMGGWSDHMWELADALQGDGTSRNNGLNRPVPVSQDCEQLRAEQTITPSTAAAG